MVELVISFPAQHHRFQTCLEWPSPPSPLLMSKNEDGRPPFHRVDRLSVHDPAIRLLTDSLTPKVNATHVLPDAICWH
jgi:hypothetical protein